MDSLNKNNKTNNTRKTRSIMHKAYGSIKQLVHSLAHMMKSFLKTVTFSVKNTATTNSIYANKEGVVRRDAAGHMVSDEFVTQLDEIPVPERFIEEKTVYMGMVPTEEDDNVVECIVHSSEKTYVPIERYIKDFYADVDYRKYLAKSIGAGKLNTGWSKGGVHSIIARREQQLEDGDIGRLAFELREERKAIINSLPKDMDPAKFKEKYPNLRMW